MKQSFQCKSKNRSLGPYLSVLAYLTGIFCVVAMLAACGGSSTNFPDGTYTTNIPGAWEMEIQGADKVLFRYAGRTIEEAEYSLSSDRIVLEPIGGQLPCKDSGTYQWISVDDTLTFTLVEDGCQNRIEVLTLGLWTKQFIY